MQKNHPKELKDLYNKYIEEVEADVKEKWANREKFSIDMKVLKDWYINDWEMKDEKALSSEYLVKLVDLKYIKDDENRLAQLLGSKEQLSHS